MSKFLAIDIGNSSVKLSLLLDGVVVSSASFPHDLPADKLARFSAEIALSCSVASPETTEAVIKRIKEFACPNVRLISVSDPLPLKIDYQSPRKLGPDRLAAAVGAFALYPDQPLLIVDAGTALTIDVIDSDACFIGGTISPGVALRFLSLNKMTARLPLINPMCEVPPIGKNTSDAIRAGVEWGIVAEIRNLYDFVMRKYGKCIPVITGGDAQLIAGLAMAHLLKLNIEDHLVAYGLYRIYKYNEDK